MKRSSRPSTAPQLQTATITGSISVAGGAGTALVTLAAIITRGKVLIIATCTITSSGTDDLITFRIDRDGVNLLPDELEYVTVAKDATIITISVTDNPTQGSHIYRLEAAGGGTPTATNRTISALY